MTTQAASKPIEFRKISIENVLFATDFSKYSNDALPYALSIARKYGAKLIALHVIESTTLGNAIPTVEVQAIAAQALREATEEMKGLESRLKDVPHETMIRRGDISEEIASIIDSRQIDLIVVGTHGRTGVSRLVVGSVAEKIFRQATCPVLTVGPDVSGEPGSIADVHTILFPTDFNPESLAALPQALSLAQEHQARLYLLYVAPFPVSDADETALRHRLRLLVPPEANLWCEPKVFVECGEASQKALELADEIGVDLIVLGTKHVSRFAGAKTHLGMATAYKIVSHATCPVVTVRG